jgi:hypothetical protein
MLNITQSKWGFSAFPEKPAFSNVKADLLFEMQVSHIIRVLGGGLESLDPNKR